MLLPCSISSLFPAEAIKDAITLQICSIRTKYIQNFPFGSTGMVFSMCASYTLDCFNVLVVLNSLSCIHIIREPGMGRSAPGKWKEELISDSSMLIIEFFPWPIHIFFFNSLKYCKAGKYSSFDLKKKRNKWITLLKEEKEVIIFPLSGKLTGKDFLCLV